jgi:gliding motility-associated-like protein
LSNPIQLNTPNGFNCAYGCAFSPNSNRVYIGCTNPNNGFLQFTIGTGVDSSVNRSRVWLNANTPIAARGFGDFSTAIDGRLYIAREDSRRISAISNPNDTGTNINFIDTAILLPPGSACFLGLPNFYNNINTPTTSIEANNLSCLTYTFRFTQVNNFNFNGLYRWDFGDGSPISTASTPTHTYARNSNDSFLVTLNFRSPDNAVSIVAQIWIRLPAKPLANFTANTNGCVGSPIVLSSNTTTINGSISSYHWSFGDNTTDTVELPIKRYGDTGTYTIKLAATDALGCRSDTAVQSININQKLVANFFSNGLNCSNTDIPIIDTSIAINTSINTWWYRWQNGANSYTSNTSGNFLISFPSEGLYSIQQVVSNNNNGCTSDTTTKLLFVFQKPQANFLLPNNCVRDRSVFTQTATVTGQTSINSWRWNFGDTTTNSDTLLQPNGTYQYANPGNYNVQLIVSTNRGCSDTSNQTFTVNGAIPKASIRFLNNPNCSGDSTIITNQSSVDFGQINRLTINWGPTLTIDTATAFNKPYRYLYNSFGTPTSIRIPIIISAASGINCVSTLDTFVTLLAQPKVRFNLPIDSICGNSSPILLQEGIELAGASGTFLYNGLGVQLQINNTYTWNPQLANNNTTNTIRYIFTTSAGCADTASQTVFVHPFPIANAGQPRTMFEGESIILNGTVLGAYNALLWLPSQLITPANSLQPTVRATQDTTLTFIATNLQGCSDTSSVRLTVLPKIKPPNSFSPNNDGINDTWILPNIEQYPNATVSIFNRHGQTIVERKPYHKPWNGTYRNMPAPVGTYYYLIHLQADKPPLSGWLLLLR